MNSWNNCFLTIAGRKILIKAIFQAIHMYYMNVFLLPVLLVMKYKWWWINAGGTEIKKNCRGINWLSWDRMCCVKNDSGRVLETCGVSTQFYWGKKIGDLWLPIILYFIRYPKQNISLGRTYYLLSWVSIIVLFMRVFYPQNNCCYRVQDRELVMIEIFMWIGTMDPKRC